MGRRIISAIDVGSSKVTTIISTLDDDDANPSVIGVYTHPAQGIKKGQIVNIDDATNSISESVTAAERMAGVTISDVYITINGQNITSMNNKGVVAVSGGEITMEDTYRAIENARTLSLPQDLNPIHIIPREFVVDNQNGIKYPIGMTGQRLEVETHIITAPTAGWKNLKKCVEQLGLTVYDIVFTGWASSLAVLTDTEKELGVAMVDIGAGTSSVTIFQDGAVSFSGCVPLGGQNITSDLAIGLQVTLEEAEKIKLNMHNVFQDKVKVEIKDQDSTPALLRKPQEEEKPVNKEDMVDIKGLDIQSKDKVSKSMIKNIVDARLEEILDMLSEIVTKAGYDIKMPAGIVMTGGSSQLMSVSKKVSDHIGVSARVGYPKGLTGMTEEISDPSYAAAQGLIKHAMDDDGESINTSKQGGVIGSIGSKVTDWFKSLMP